MFYREYRPQSFTEIIGSQDIVASITAALAKPIPPHAYFFSGSRGIGKTTTARLVAKTLNCANPIKTPDSNVSIEPCGECLSCKAFAEGNHIDLTEIDAASNRGIDNIRELSEKIGLAPVMGKRKIFIIDEVHMLTTEASNALLKTLEEPPEHVFFILCTTNPEKVLDTIKSRCLQFNFKKPSVKDINTKLKKIIEDKKISIDEKIINDIAISAKGAFRDAETILEQFASFNDINFIKNETTDYVELLNLIFDGKRKESLSKVFAFSKSDISFDLWIGKFSEFTRCELLFFFFLKDALSDFSISQDDEKYIATFSVEKLKSLLIELNKNVEAFKYSSIASLPLEITIINFVGESETVKSVPLNINPPKVIDITPQKIKPVEVAEKAPQAETNIEPSVITDAKIITEEILEIKTEPVVIQNETPQKTGKKVDFDFKDLCLQLKETNHSIYLLLGSARYLGFDGVYLNLAVPFSFHKERLTANKFRTAIELTAEKIAGCKVLLNCELISKTDEAESLTDHNVKPIGEVPLEKVFEDVFGDDVQQS